MSEISKEDFNALYKERDWFYDELEKAQKENKALAAKCAELEAAVNRCDVMTRKAYISGPTVVLNLKKALEKHPKTCLADIEARAVESFGKEIGLYDSEYDDQEYIEVSRYGIKDYIDKLRQQAGGCDE